MAKCGFNALKVGNELSDYKPRRHKMTDLTKIDLRSVSNEQIDAFVIKAKNYIKAKQEIEDFATKRGFNVSELFAEPTGLAKAAKTAVAYCNPHDPSQTWAGRGARPKWLKEALDSGVRLEHFKVGDGPLPKSSKKATKATGTKKRKIAQKYRNPDDHSEIYGGYGPKPGWLKDKVAAGVPLESMFL